MVIERGELDLPLEDFLVGSHLNLNPSVQAKQYLDVRLRGDRLVLLAGKYIGLIPLNASYAIHVRPKVPTANLIAILRAARREPEVLGGLENLYRADEHLSLFELLVRALHREIRVLEWGGMPREYIRREGELSHFGGKLLLKETLLRQWAKNSYTHGTFAYFEYSRDVVINRAVYYTLWHVLRTYPLIATKVDRRMLADLDQAAAAFQHVTLDLTRSFLPSLRALLRRDALPDSRAYMRRLLHICRMILDDLGVDLEDVLSLDVAIPPLVINMEAIFQQFLLNSVRQYLPPDLDCWDTTTERRLPLFREPIQSPSPTIPVDRPGKELAEPDFVIAAKPEPLLVCDAKYTRERDRGDVYQIVTHAAAYGVGNALLIYPATSSTEAGRCVCLGNVGNVRVFTYRYPLDADDLVSASRALVASCISIIQDERDNLK